MTSGCSGKTKGGPPAPPPGVFHGCAICAADRTHAAAQNRCGACARSSPSAGACCRPCPGPAQFRTAPTSPWSDCGRTSPPWKTDLGMTLPWPLQTPSGISHQHSTALRTTSKQGAILNHESRCRECPTPAPGDRVHPLSQSPNIFCFSSRRCWASSDRVAVGRASRRPTPMGSPVSSQ